MPAWWPWPRHQQPPPPLPPVLPPAAPAPDERRYLERVLAESRSVLDSDPTSFQLVESRSEFKVFSRPVKSGKGLTMARLEAEVPLREDTLFKLLTSMDGKCIIDPFPRERHSEHVQSLCLPQGEAAVVYSEAPRFIGLLRPREYVTCDAALPGERLFVCKSCEAAGGPLAQGAAKGKVRANLLFALRVKEVEGRPGVTRLQMINWLDLGRDTVPVWLANAVTERWFFQGVDRRLRRYLSRHGLRPDTPPDALQLQSRIRPFAPS
ncbi:hypothetical protein ABPG75_008721 [Micractinium tetrahymenae]